MRAKALPLPHTQEHPFQDTSQSRPWSNTLSKNNMSIPIIPNGLLVDERPDQTYERYKSILRGASGKKAGQLKDALDHYATNAPYWSETQKEEYLSRYKELVAQVGTLKGRK